MKNTGFILVICIIILSSSCTRQQTSRLEQALTLAGENRGEMEQVLLHYSKEQPDEQKLAAARFLIINMVGKRNLDTLSVAANQPYFDALATYRKQYGDYGREGIYMICDSVRDHIANAAKPAPRYTSDLTHLSARFLITHIDRSFEAWQKYPWTASLGFDDFCNYILPYNVAGSYWEGTISYFIEIYSEKIESLANLSIMDAGKYIDRDIQAGFKSDGTFFRENYPFLKPIAFRNLLNTRVGECIDMNALNISAMRSMGVPAALEMIPYWGNSNASHFWTRITGEPVRGLHPNTQMTYTCPEDELISDTFWFKYVFTDTTGIPPQVNIRTSRTVPKIYRELYALQLSSLACQAKEEIPAFFRNPGLEDVTERYVQCKDITVSLSPSQAVGHYVYLCCYNPEQLSWTAVDWAEVHRGKATFHHAGVNIVYITAGYQNGMMIPVGNPFLLTDSGVCRQLDADKSARDTAVFYSKVPYRTHILYYASRMLGRKFQVANRMDLSDATDIHSIDKIPYYTQDVKITDAPPARYALYKFSEPNTECIAELEFWGLDETGKEVKLQGKEIGNAGVAINPRHNAFDGDRVSFFYNEVSDKDYIGVDFGTPRKITRIKYCPWNDDNGIVPGELYELFYWEDGWKSLGRQTGRDDYRLRYDHVPGNALLRIHNHTRGKEHRPFTYENGKQVWW